MYALVLFQIMAWNQIVELDTVGPFDSRSECELTMYIGAKFLQSTDPKEKYFLLCRKI